ncbi:hypothetical protein BDP27DRAFT_1319963 [Rhodocollybia butyracea]|uniref:Uncharacterized protein n=1 Tax=Rhodocollybia butyracea TaxID=206335 RepID=A0A9P5UC35_9AGAR|nr:hypothetical protein BDP27DRAFT_1319963 [Rhodocollybia butyracea]
MANVTIDDADPSIIYLPDGAWNTRNPTAPCPGCGTNPNYAMMFDDTFHDGTFFPAANVPLTASMLFNGTAVYIFCALAQSSNGISDMTFFIDGVNRGTFTRSIAPGIPYQYSIPVFSIASLSPGQHTLTIQNGHVNGTKALTMLDEIIYTAVDTISSSTSASTSSQSISSTSPISSQQSPTSNADSAKSTKKNSGIIIGPIVAVVLVVALGLGLFFWWKRRRPQSGNPRRTMRDYDAPGAWMSEPLSLPSSHPAYSSASDAQASFGVAAELLPSSGRGNGPRAGPSSTAFYPSNGTSGIQASIDNAGTPSNLYLSPTSSQPVQQSPISTDDTSSPLTSYPSSAPQQHAEDEATLDDVPPAYDEQRRKSTRAAEDREIAVM